MRKMTYVFTFVLLLTAVAAQAGVGANLFQVALALENAQSCPNPSAADPVTLPVRFNAIDGQNRSLGSCSVTVGECSDSPGCSNSGLCTGWSDTGSWCCTINGRNRCCQLGQTVHTRSCQCVPLQCGLVNETACM